MKRYVLSLKTRKIGGCRYRIRRVYNPNEDIHEYQLQKADVRFGQHPYYETKYTTHNMSKAEKWAEEMGLCINEQLDVIR